MKTHILKNCAVFDGKDVRLIKNEDISHLRGFYLVGQGIGDMICMLPTIEKVANLLNRKLDVWTYCPEVFKNHPLIDVHCHNTEKINQDIAQGSIYIVTPIVGGGIGLPSRFKMHLIDQTALNVINLDDNDKEISLHSSAGDMNKAELILNEFKNKKKIILHTSKAAEIRSWPIELWQELAKKLLAEDLGVVSVGKDTKYIGNEVALLPKSIADLNIINDYFIDLTNQTSIHQLFELIKVCDMVVTMDSGVLHIANCTDTFIVAIFTDVDPHFRMRYRQGKIGYKTISVSNPCVFQYCASRYEYNENKCRQPPDKYMCCLPDVDTVYKMILEKL